MSDSISRSIEVWDLFCHFPDLLEVFVFIAYLRKILEYLADHNNDNLVEKMKWKKEGGKGILQRRREKDEDFHK